MWPRMRMSRYLLGSAWNFDRVIQKQPARLLVKDWLFVDHDVSGVMA